MPTACLWQLHFQYVPSLICYFPIMQMIKVWQDLLPGFTLANWWGFIIGLIESYACDWYFAFIWVPLYNYFVSGGEIAGNKEKNHAVNNTHDIIYSF